jgi:hypothetical protein
MSPLSSEAQNIDAVLRESRGTAWPDLGGDGQGDRLSDDHGMRDVGGEYCPKAVYQDSALEGPIDPRRRLESIR